MFFIGMIKPGIHSWPLCADGAYSGASSIYCDLCGVELIFEGYEFKMIELERAISNHYDDCKGERRFPKD